mmetsp:Transcript_2494/g.8554  ORF Transcript_2494/g.8554 Transcript_2494/m.8554 type:complete len:224 (+) Transcript_2494:933-1604(+)
MRPGLHVQGSVHVLRQGVRMRPRHVRQPDLHQAQNPQATMRQNREEGLGHLAGGGRAGGAVHNRVQRRDHRRGGVREAPLGDEEERLQGLLHDGALGPRDDRRHRQRQLGALRQPQLRAQLHDPEVGARQRDVRGDLCERRSPGGDGDHVRLPVRVLRDFARLLLRRQGMHGRVRQQVPEAPAEEEAAGGERAGGGHPGAVQEARGGLSRPRRRGSPRLQLRQ